MIPLYILAGLILATSGYIAWKLSTKEEVTDNTQELREENAQLKAELKQRIEEIGRMTVKIDAERSEKDKWAGTNKQMFLEATKLEAKIEENNVLTISGIDKQLVGQFTANIRKLKPVEPYKGKGFRYVGEHVRRKAGKKAAATK